MGFVCSFGKITDALNEYRADMYMIRKIEKKIRSVSWNFALFIGCSLLRFQSGVHLGAKTDERKQRYIQVTRIKTEDEMKMKEQEKQSAELVSV